MPSKIKQKANQSSSLKEKIAIQLTSLKNYIANGTDDVDLKVQYIEDEMEIRVESLKNELDKFNEKFKVNLKAIKENMISFESEKIKKACTLLKRFESRFDEILNETNFLQLQNEYNAFNKEIEELEKVNQNIQLNIEEELDEKLIGNLLYSNSIESNIRETISSGEYETIKLEYKPSSFCHLPDNKIVAQFYDRLEVYDENMKLVKKKIEVNSIPLRCSEIQCNEDCQIYVLDSDNNRIILMNSNLEVIRSFESFGVRNNQMRLAWDFCYKNGYLYICDSGNCRIQVLDKQLYFHDTLSLDFNQPMYVKVNDATIFIQSVQGNVSKSYFYDLESFTLNYKYEHSGTINELNGYFYLFENNLYKLYCFDKNGYLMHAICLSRFMDIHYYKARLFHDKLSNQLAFFFGDKVIKFKNSDSKKELDYNVMKISVDYYQDLFVLPEDQVIVATEDSEGCAFKLYDDELNLLKKMKKLNKQGISLAVFGINENKQVCISNYDQTGFHVLDKKLNVIDFSITDFYYSSFSFKNGKFYGWDDTIRSIKVFTKKFKYIKDFVINEDIKDFKVNENICMISKGDYVLFYDLQTFTLVNKYKHGDCKIFEINSRFYAINDQKPRRVFTYDANGVVINERRLSNLDEDMQNTKNVKIFILKQKLAIIFIIDRERDNTIF